MAKQNVKAKKNERKTVEWNYVTAGLMVATTAGLLAMAYLKSCKPEPEGPATETTQADKKECPAPPSKDDKKCEPEKGEHDPASANWDPKNCGYCGDRKEQKPWETEETCPVDFVCAKDPEEREQHYGGIVEKKGKEGTLYVFDIIDPAKFCPQGEEKKEEVTKQEKKPGKMVASAPVEQPKAVETPKPAKRGKCEAGVVGSARSLKANIGSRLRGNAGSIRSAAGVEGVPVTAFISVYVDTNGTATIASSSATCGGEACKNRGVSPHQAAGITSGGLPTVTAPPAPCTFTFSVTLPAG